MGCTNKHWGRELANATARPLSIILGTPQLEAVSYDPEKANVTPLFKKEEPYNYTPVILTSFLEIATNPGKPFPSLWRTKSFLRKKKLRERRSKQEHLWWWSFSSQASVKCPETLLARSGWTSAYWWKVVNELPTLLRLHAQLLLSLLNHHELDWLVFLSSFYFLPIPQETGGSKRLGGCLTAAQGQPTTKANAVWK